MPSLTCDNIQAHSVVAVGMLRTLLSFTSHMEVYLTNVATPATQGLKPKALAYPPPIEGGAPAAVNDLFSDLTPPLWDNFMEALKVPPEPHPDAARNPLLCLRYTGARSACRTANEPSG